MKVTEKSASMIVEDVSFQDTTISSKMDFVTINDFVTYEVEIKNNSDRTYTLSKIINHLNTNYLNVESNDTGISISGGERKTLHVRVKYAQELINQESYSPNDSSITLNFVDTTKIENPFTLDRWITMILILFMITFVISCTLYYQKLKKIALILLFFIPVFVFAQEMLNINFQFSNVKVRGSFLSYRIQLDDGSGNVQDYTKIYGETVGDFSEGKRTYTHRSLPLDKE